MLLVGDILNSQSHLQCICSTFLPCKENNALALINITQALIYASQKRWMCISKGTRTHSTRILNYRTIRTHWPFSNYPL